MYTTIIKSNLTAVINSQGAELISLKNNLNQREYVWEGHPDFWAKQSPVLFPIVGTLKNNSYIYQNKKYNLQRHGFARDRNFEIIHRTDQEVIFSLQANDETFKMYPFDFELQIGYVLDGMQLTVSYKIINKTADVMPFSIGAHPAFALPERFSSYVLEFENDKTLLSYLLKNDLVSDTTLLIPTQNKQLPLSYDLFDNDALIFKNLQSRKVTILESGNPLLHLCFDDFPHFGIWTKRDAPFICLEPWLGYADLSNTSGEFVNKEALQFIKPKSNFNCAFSIEIL